MGFERQGSSWCRLSLLNACRTLTLAFWAGTITVGDIQVVTMFAIDSLAVSTAAAQNLSHKYDIKARHSALNCVRAWAAKGYQPVYVSGRQGSYYNLTMEW